MKAVRRKNIKVLIGTLLALALLTGITAALLIRNNREISSKESVSVEEITEDFYDEESGVYDTESIKVSEGIFDNEFEGYNGISSSHDGKKEIYLTFDDGPSIYTDDILDILDNYGIKATFFVLAKTDDISVKAYKRIVNEGHTLAIHSYSHKYSTVYENKQSFIEDISSLQEYLYGITGVWSRIYRFPGGSSNTVSRTDMSELIAYLNEEGIKYYDWNISSNDATAGRILSADTIKNNCLRDIDKYDECMILMHDSGARRTTVDALDDIIEAVNARGDSVFLAITDDTVPIQHRTK